MARLSENTQAQIAEASLLASDLRKRCMAIRREIGIDLSTQDFSWELARLAELLDEGFSEYHRAKEPLSGTEPGVTQWRQMLCDCIAQAWPDARANGHPLTANDKALLAALGEELLQREQGGCKEATPAGEVQPVPMEASPEVPAASTIRGRFVFGTRGRLVLLGSGMAAGIVVFLLLKH